MKLATVKCSLSESARKSKSGRYWKSGSYVHSSIPKNNFLIFLFSQKIFVDRVCLDWKFVCVELFLDRKRKPEKSLMADCPFFSAEASALPKRISDKVSPDSETLQRAVCTYEPDFLLNFSNPFKMCSKVLERNYWKAPYTYSKALRSKSHCLQTPQKTCF